MTEQLLPFDAPASLRDQVAAYFRARPGEWVDVLPLAQLAGIGGWRTRCSNCRTELGMTIENRQQRWPDGRKRSQYRYVTALEEPQS